MLILRKYNEYWSNNDPTLSINQIKILSYVIYSDKFQFVSTKQAGTFELRIAS